MASVVGVVVGSSQTPAECPGGWLRVAPARTLECEVSTINVGGGGC